MRMCRQYSENGNSFRSCLSMCSFFRQALPVCLTQSLYFLSSPNLLIASTVMFVIYRTPALFLFLLQWVYPPFSRLLMDSKFDIPQPCYHFVFLLTIQTDIHRLPPHILFSYLKIDGQLSPILPFDINIRSCILNRGFTPRKFTSFRLLHNN